MHQDAGALHVWPWLAACTFYAAGTKSIEAYGSNL